MSTESGTRRFLAALALYAALALVLVGPAIFGPRDLYVEDFPLFEAPRDRFLARSLEAGEGIPRWAPGIWGGVPALASQELAFLYPPNVLLVLVAPERARAISLALHLVLAALGVRALARRLEADETGALLAGTVYAFGGYVLATHFSSPYVRSQAWLPWALAGLHRASEKDRRGLPLAVLGLAGMLFSGDPQGCALAALVSVLAGVALRGKAGALAAGRASIVALGLTLLVGAVQVLPAALVFGDGIRVLGLPWEVATRWSVWPPELLGLLVPFVFGSRAHPGTLWFPAFAPDKERAFAETLYVGPVALALALAGARHLRATAAGRVGLVLALAFLPFAFGKFLPLYSIVYALPGGNLVRFPVKFLTPAWLGLALLAGAGATVLSTPAEELGRRARSFLREVLSALSGGAFAAGLVATLGASRIALWIQERKSQDVAVLGDVDAALAARAVGPHLLHAALVAGAGWLVVVRAVRASEARSARAARLPLVLLALVVVDLAFTLRDAVPLAPREPFVRPPRLTQAIEEEEARQGAPCRVLSAAGAEKPTAADAAEVDSAALTALAYREAFSHSVGSGYGVLGQRGALSNPPLRGELLQRQKVASWKLAALSGARLAVVGEETRLEPGVSVVAAAGGRRLVRVPGAPFWAAVYARGHYVASFEQALTVVSAPVFSPERDVILETEGPEGPRGVPPRAAKLVGKYGNHGFTLAAEGPGWLVVRESYARGWRATIDDVPAPIVAADGLFRAVWLATPGEHRVRFVYEAPGLLAGALASALGIVSIGVLVVRGRRLPA